MSKHCNLMTIQSFCFMPVCPETLQVLPQGVSQYLYILGIECWSNGSHYIYFDNAFVWFVWYVFYKGTVPTTCNQTFIRSHVRAWILKKGLLLDTPVPYIPYCCTQEKTWNVFRDMVVGNISFPVAAFQRLGLLTCALLPK